MYFSYPSGTMSVLNRVLLPLMFAVILAVQETAANAAAPSARFVLVTSTGPIGSLAVTDGGSATDTHWRVDDNGRGPKIKEHIELGPGGLPVRWDLEGTSEFGGPVKESFRVNGTRAEWVTLDDKGNAEARDPLYLVKSGTPWAIQIYLSALLAAKDNTLEVLPSGRLRLEKLRDVEIGEGKTREGVTAYALWGLDVTPAFLLARKDRLVATLSPGWVFVEEAHGNEFAPMSTLAAGLSGELLAAFSAKVTHPFTLPLWITNVSVFDPLTKKVGQPLNVGLFGKTIVAVGTEDPPKDALIVNGTGATLLPGLFDSHNHATDWGGPMNIACGVTLGRDPGNDNQTLLELERRIENGEVVGPRMKKSGFLEGKSPYSANLGFVVATVNEALEKVRWYRSHGFWGIKIYNSMNPEFVKPIAAEAHRLGMHVSGHVPAFMSSERAILDGYDEINHINQLMLSLVIDPLKDDTRTPFRFTALGERMANLDLSNESVQRLVRLMKERHITLDPTLATFSPLLMGRPGKTGPADATWLDHMPATVQRTRRTMMLDLKPEQYPLYDASWAKLEATLRMLDEAGITLVPGTDDTPGFILHSELEAWAKAGIPAGKAISYATLGGARFLGLEAQLGTIEVGKLADLYLVQGDPTKDIIALRNGLLTVKDGAYFYPDEIHTKLGITPFVSHAEVRKPAPQLN